MALIRDLLTEMRPGLHQAPDFSLIDALTRSVQKLCQSSGIWRVVLDPVPLVDGRAGYELELPTDSRLERVISATLANRPIRLHRLRDLHAAGARMGWPTAIAMTPDADGVTLFPTPDAYAAGAALSLYVALVPTRDAREIPDFLADEWHAAIVAGAKAEMLATPDMPWTNPAQADLHGRFFVDEVARASRSQFSEHATELRVAQRPWI